MAVGFQAKLPIRKQVDEFAEARLKLEDAGKGGGGGVCMDNYAE